MPYIVNIEKNTIFYDCHDMAELYSGMEGYKVLPKDEALQVVKRTKPGHVISRITDAGQTTRTDQTKPGLGRARISLGNNRLQRVERGY